MLRKKIIMLVAISLVGIVVVLLFLLTANPKDVIKKKLGLELPDSAKVVCYTFNRYTGYFEAKIYINNKDVLSVKNDLLTYFKQENIRLKEFGSETMNHIPKWWDLQTRDVYFYKMEKGIPYLDGLIAPLTAYNLAVLSSQSDGKYYLYLDFEISVWKVLFR